MRDLFVFDLDGTLVHGRNEARRIPSQLLENIRELAPYADVTIATGRRFRAALVDIAELMTLPHFRSELIVHNGLVVKSKEGKTLRAERLDLDHAYLISNLLSEIGFSGFWICDGYEENVDYIFAEEDLGKSLFLQGVFERTKGLHKIIKDRKEILNESLNVIEVAMLGDPQSLTYVRETIRDRLPQGFKDVLVRNIGASADLAALEFFHAHCSKWAGIQSLESPFRKIIAVGDDENDFEMIKCADVGVMMSGGFPGLKSVADEVVEGVEGLSAFLKGFYKNEKS